MEKRTPHYRLSEIQAGHPCPVCFQGVLRRRVQRVAMDYKGRLFEQDQPGDWCDQCGEGQRRGFAGHGTGLAGFPRRGGS